MSPYDDTQKNQEEEGSGDEETEGDKEEEPGQDVDWSAEDFESEEGE